MIDPLEISLFIPVYERFDFFEAAIDSVLTQSIRPGKIIVVDNCSSHSRFEDIILSKNNKTIKYIRNSENLGMVGNWNRCLEICDTKWMTILHDDDCLHQNWVKRMIEISEYLNDDADVIACLCSVGREPNYQRVRFGLVTQFSETDFLYTTLTQFPGVLVSKSLLSNVGGFDERYYPCADLKLWIELSKAGKVYQLREQLAFYRISKNQTSYSEFLLILNKACEIRSEILNSNNGMINRFLFKRALILQLNNYLTMYNLKFEGVFRKMTLKDCSYQVLSEFEKERERIGGEILYNLFYFVFRVLASIKRLINEY